MADFEQLYNPEPEQLNLSPEPTLTPLQDPFKDFNPQAYVPEDSGSFAQQQFADFEKKFSKPSLDQMLEPISYDPVQSRRDRYVNSDYFSELGFNPFDDNEELYGQRQTIGNKLKNAFLGAGVLAAQQFAEQLGSWGDTVSAIRELNIQNAFEQSEMEELYRKQQQFFSDYPIFETQDERESILNFNTVANIVQQSGYAVGAIAEIAAEELALSALTAATFSAASGIQAARTAALASRIGNVVRKTEQLSKSLNSTNNLRKIFNNVYRALPLTSTADFLTGLNTIRRIEDIAAGGRGALSTARTAARGFGAFYRDIRELNVAIAEAKAEAAGTYGDLVTELTNDFIENRGRRPNQFELDEIRRIALEAAHTNGAANVLTILLTNKIGMGNVLRGFKPLRHLVDEDIAVKGVTMLSDKQALKTGTKLVEAAENKFLTFKQKLLSNPIKYTAANLSEGLQESLQSMSNDAVSAYYAAKYNGEVKSWMDSVKEAASNQFSVEGAKTFLSGFITGSILGAGGKLISKGEEGLQFLTDRQGYKERVSAEREARKRYIDQFNAMWNNPLGYDFQRGDFQTQSNFTNLLKQAVASGDKKFFYDIKDDATREFIMTGIYGGTLDVLTDRLQDYVKELSPEEFTKAFEVEYTEENYRKMSEAVDQFAARANDVKNIYENLRENYSNPFNPGKYDKDSKEYQREVLGHIAYKNAINQMVFMKDSYQRAIVRQNQILTSIGEIDGAANLGFNTVYTLGSVEELNREIKLLDQELKVTPNAEKSRRKDLLTKYKKSVDRYIKEYERIIKNTSGKDQEEAIQALDNTLHQEISPVIKDVFNEQLKRDRKPVMMDEALKEVVSDMIDYYKLSSESGVMLDNINMVVDPQNFNNLLTRHLDEIEKIFEKLRQEADKKEQAPKRSVTITVTDKNGNQHEVELREGDFYITESNPQKRLTPKGQVTQTYNQDIIEILSLDDDLVSVELNDNGETVSFSLDEFAATVGKISNFSALTPNQRLFFRNRDVVFDLSVRKHNGKLHKLSEKDYTQSGVYVKARLAMKKEGNEWKVKIVYINPVTGQTEEVDYNHEYVRRYNDGKKWNLRVAPILEEALLKQDRQRLEVQKATLWEMIAEQEQRVEEIQSKREENERRFSELADELRELEKNLQAAIKDLQNNPWSGRGRKPNRVKLISQLQEKIQKLEEQLASLEQEKQDLENLKTAAEELIDLYFQTVTRIEETGRTLSNSETEIQQLEQQIGEIESELITRRFSRDELDKMISDTEAEISLIDERMSFIQNLINSARRLLNKLLSYEELYDTLKDATDRADLVSRLRRLEDSADEDQKILLKAIRKAFVKGDIASALDEVSLNLANNIGSSELLNELNGLGLERDVLSGKLHRLITTREQLGQIDSIKDRIQKLKTLQEGIEDWQTRQKEAALLSQAIDAAKSAENQKDLTSQDIDPDVNTPTFSQDKKPKFSAAAFNKTFGRQYLDDKDTELNTENGSDRFFRFTATQSVAGEGYYLQVVTEDNDTFGIRQPEYPTEIKVIVVKKVGDEYQYVGEDGKILDNPTKDTIIYRTLANIASWTPERVRRDYTIPEGVTDEHIQQVINHHAAYQQSLKDRVKKGPVYLSVVSSSPGVQRVERLSTVDENGKHPIAEAELEGRVIVDNPDWRDLRSANNPDKNIELVVSTANGVPVVGINAGRIVAREYRLDNSGNKIYSDKVYRVFNRQLTEEEKQNIIEVLIRFSKLFGRANTKDEKLKLSSEERKEFNLIVSYLRNVIGWGLPKKLEGSDNISSRFFWIHNGLHRGNLKIDFNEKSIRENADKLLEGVYHHVNNKTLQNETIQDDRSFQDDISFNTIKIKSGKAVIDKEYISYTQYLLEKRESGVPPVYTSLPRVDSGIPQRTNVYLNWADPAVEAPSVPALSNPVQSGGLKPQTGRGRVLFTPKSTKTEESVKPEAPAEQPSSGGLKPQPAGGNVIASFGPKTQSAPQETKPAPQAPTSQEGLKPQPSGGRTVVSFGNKQQSGQATPQQVAQLQNITAQPGPYLDIKSAVSNATISGNRMTAVLHTRNQNTGEVKVALEVSVIIPEGNINVARNILRAEILKRLNYETDEDVPHRLSLEEMQQTEDFKAVAEFFRKYLPQVPVYVIGHLIHGKAWGAFINNAIYLYENAEIGTAYHEAFHAVWDLYLPLEEQRELAKEFRSRTGTFTNPFTKETKPYSEASDYDVIEMLAEEFRRFVLDGKLPKGNKITSFFRKLWEFITGIFGLSPTLRREMDDKIHAVFKKIGRGGYKNIKPIRERNVSEPRYRAIGELTQTETSEVLEGMTYYFFLELFKDGKTIDHLIDGLNVKLNNELLNNLYQKALDLTLDRLQIVDSRVASNVQSEAYNELYAEFRKGLRKHGIRFDEDVLTKEEDSGTVNALGIRDTISIDPRKMTNTNIRLLLSSLPNCYYNEKGGLRPSLNYLGLPQLVDGDRVHTILLNELSNTVSYTDANGNQVSVLSQMFAKLDQKYLLPNGQYRNGYVWIKNLKLRLRIEDISGTPIPVESLTPDDIRLRIGFIKSFTNVKTVPQKAIVEEGGLVYNFNPVASVNTDRVRETWANNLKETIRPSGGLLKSEPDGTISFNRDSQQYKDLISLLNNRSAFKIEQALDALSQLGITFSAPVEDYAIRVREHAIQILERIKEGTVNSVSELYTDQIVEGRMKELLEIETRLSSEENILSYMNAEGKPQYSVGIPSLLSTMINILNSVGSLTELINSCPWLGTIVDGQPVLYGYNAGSQLLRPGGMIFKKDGSKYPGKALSYEVISGMGLGDVDGVNTADLQFPERVSNKIHYLLPKKERRGFHYTVFSNINSDKSTEFGIGFYGQPPINKNYNGLRAVQIYIDHLRDELYAAQLESRYPSNIQYYSKEASSLGHFRDILGDKLVSKFRREVLGDKPRFKGNDAYDKWLNANMADIQAAIERHIDKITNDTVSFLKDLDIFELAEQGMYITNAIDNKLLREFLDVWEGQTVEFIRDGEVIQRPAFTEDDLKTLAGYLAVNEEILITEQHKLLYGHPAFYKDLPKRANGATSTKEPVVDDPEIIQWMDNNMQRLDGKKRSEETHQTFSVISFKDQKVVSRQWKGIAEGMYQNMISSGMSKTEAENLVGARFNEDGTFESFILKDGEYTGHIKPYLELNEADAMAWGMPDIIRDMLFLSGKLTKEQEAQWNYEVAYEKVARSKKPKNHPAYKKYKPQELEAAQRIVEKGDPGHILQVLKPQYFGFAENDFMMHPVFLKHAVQPKFYRHVEGTQYENLYLAAQKNKVDIIGFESGEKVGNPMTDKGELVDLYRPDGTINLTEDNDLPSELPKQKLYTRFYGIQVETPNVAKNAVVRGTQVTKLVMLNFFENGNPVSERAGDIISEMNTTLERMMELGKDKLIKDLGLIRTEDGYKTWDLTKLVKTLRAECENRDLPDNAIDALNVLEDEAGAQHLLYKFDTLIHRDKIDSILNSIVDSRVISEKFHGKSSVQVASTGYESNPRNYVYLRDGVYHQLTDPNALTEEERKSIRMSSSDLQFYINKDGQITGMECYISWPFEGVTPEELGLEFKNGVYLPNDKIDSRLLKAIGFRIPTQGMNSIENIIIKGFTPAANGDMIVVPSEIVGKAGSDFDIDKLNLYLPNYSSEVYEKNYKSEEFKNFMLEDLQHRGMSPKDAERVMEAYTPKDFYMINRATYSDKGKEEKNAPYSLVDLVDNEVLDTVAFIKKSLSRYNRSVKSGKHLVYIEPGEDTKESLQNYYIDLMSELISLPENYRQLTTPNGAETLKALAKEVTELKVKAGTKRKIDEKSFSYLRSFIGNTSIRERYLTAKRMVGIAALHNTFHAMAQVAGIKLSGQYKPVKYLSFGEESLPVKIKLTHTDPDENGHYPLGILSDKSGYYISDLFSEALTGFVDGAKDPFVFDLNFSMNTASTWFYLQHMGVPVDEVSYFMNQPVLDEYFDQFAKNRSNFKRANGSNLTREDLFLKVIEPYYKKLTGKDTIRIINLATGFQKYSLKEMFRVELAEIAAKYEQFGKKELLDNIRKGNNADPGMQIAVLMSYLEYEQQARQLSNFIRAIGYDNKKTKSIQENKMQVSNWERSKNEGFIQNPEDILKYTFIGEMKKHKEDVFDMFKEFFVTLSEEVQPAFEMLQNKIDDPDFFMAKDDMSNLITRYQNFIVGYLLHTSAVPTEDGQMSLNHRYQEMFFGENSMARKLLKLKENIDPAIRENRIIRELLPIISPDTQRPDSIKLFRSKMDTMSINNVIESLNELRHYALQTSDADLLQFTKDLAIFSILQSGVQNSTFDFRKALPTEIYSELVKEILERGKTNLDPNHIWDMFHQNNWNNRTIVPKAPSWLKIKNGVLKVKSTSPVTVNDFILKYVRKSGLTYDQVRQMKAKAFEPVLFKKSHLEGDKWVYVPINRMGDGTRMLEVYTDKRESVLDKNRIGGGSIPVLPSGNQRPSTWYELFPNQKDRAEILSNFAKTHNLTLPEAHAYINAVVQDPDENLQDIVKKLKECYLLTT